MRVSTLPASFHQCSPAPDSLTWSRWWRRFERKSWWSYTGRGQSAPGTWTHKHQWTPESWDTQLSQQVRVTDRHDFPIFPVLSLIRCPRQKLKLIKVFCFGWDSDNSVNEQDPCKHAAGWSKCLGFFTGKHVGLMIWSVASDSPGCHPHCSRASGQRSWRARCTLRILQSPRQRSRWPNWVTGRTLGA